MPTSGRRSTASWSWSRGLSAGGAIAGAAATLACLVAGQLVAAAVCGLATVGLGLRLVLGVATREGQSDTAEPDEEIPHGALGRGPYRSYKCEASAEMAVSLSRVVQQLRDAAVEETWRIDWDAFSRLNDAATAALGKKKYRQAIRDFCRAMSFMMNELRHQNESASPQRSTSSDDATS